MKTVSGVYVGLISLEITKYASLAVQGTSDEHGWVYHIRHISHVNFTFPLNGRKANAMKCQRAAIGAVLRHDVRTHCMHSHVVTPGLRIHLRAIPGMVHRLTRLPGCAPAPWHHRGYRCRVIAMVAKVDKFTPGPSTHHPADPVKSSATYNCTNLPWKRDSPYIGCGIHIVSHDSSKNITSTWVRPLLWAPETMVNPLGLTSINPSL